MRHRSVRVIAGLLALGLIAASCSDDDSTPAGTAPTDDAAADDAAMADEQPAEDAAAEDAAMADEQPAEDAAAEDAAADDAAMADEQPADDAAADDAAAEPAGVDLASVCPNPLVIQTGWFPQAERAWFWV